MNLTNARARVRNYYIRTCHYNRAIMEEYYNRAIMEEYASPKVISQLMDIDNSIPGGHFAIVRIVRGSTAHSRRTAEEL